jgi:hypothetical protein
MPRHPKPENRNNPLRQLRGLLSPEGDAAPIKQWELERLIGVPVATIRAIEAGRRKLNDDVLRKVYFVTHFLWDPVPETWTLEGRPAVSSDWQIVQKFTKRRPPGYELAIDFMHLRLEALFQKVLQKDWWLLANRINDYLETCKDDFKLQGLETLFRDTSIQMHNELYKRSVLPGPGFYTVDAVKSFISSLSLRRREAVADWFLKRCPVPVADSHS